MQFERRLRPGIRDGSINCTVRIWKNLRVRVGGRYKMEDGEIEIDSITFIGFPDITIQLARASGFTGALDLLKTAKHGTGDKSFLIHFHYIPPKHSAGCRID